MQRKLTYALGIILLFTLSACSDSSPEESKVVRSESPELMGVSVWDRISTRSQPLRSAPRTTLMSLGERFVFLDSMAIDSASTPTKFLKARLSDSTIVWVYDFATVLNAKPAVVVADVPLYMRPDLLTITAKSLDAMDIVAVLEEWDDWIKVINEKKEDAGWIKRESIAYTTIDLAFSLLVKRNLEEEDPGQKISNLEDLLENNPYPNTIFIGELNKRIDQEKELLWEIQYEQDRENQDHRQRRR